MLRKLTSEVLERRTVFSASPIVAIGGDAGFMDYTDDSVQAAASSQATGDVDGADFLAVHQRGNQLAGDGFGLLPYVEQDNLYRGSQADGPSPLATDAVMEQIGRDPQGIIAILIGLYAPKDAPGANLGAQRIDLRDTPVSNFLVPKPAGQPSVPAEPYLQVELENTLVSSVVARTGKPGILHEDNEFSFPRM